MRLRFSLRLVFVALTLVAVALYTLFVRPTLLAERFVTAIEQRDYATAKLLLQSKNFWKVAERPKQGNVDFIYAELHPREWGDVWACKRRVIFRVAFHEDTDGRHVDWTTDIDVVAHITGLEAAYFINRTDDSEKPAYRLSGH